tara:strand:+ start:68 stop:334 length:267 start_codon:yes stop_codon:yes gene_type:complete
MATTTMMISMQYINKEEMTQKMTLKMRRLRPLVRPSLLPPPLLLRQWKKRNKKKKIIRVPVVKEQLLEKCLSEVVVRQLWDVQCIQCE